MTFEKRYNITTTIIHFFWISVFSLVIFEAYMADPILPRSVMQRRIYKIVKGVGSSPNRVHLVTLRGPIGKGATGAQCAAGRLQEKSEGALPDGTFDG